MPDFYGGYGYGQGEYAGPPVANSPGSQLNGGQFPVIIGEIGFGNGALDDPVTWTDITQWLRNFTINRGRQHELQRFEAGTAALTLDNRDGRFSPFNGSSPYSPNILPLVPIRIRAIWNGLTWPLFRGNVESWALKWPTASDSDVVVSAVDASKALNSKKATTLSQYPATILADTPYLYWRLGDTAGSGVAVDSSGNGRNGTPSTFDPAQINQWFFGGEGGVAADIDTGFDCGNAAGQITATVSLLQNSVSFECWVKPRSLPPDPNGAGVASTLLTLSNSLGASQKIVLQINNNFVSGVESGVPFVHVDNGLGAIVDIVARVKIISHPITSWGIRFVETDLFNETDPLSTNDGQWHHYIVTSNGTTVNLYIDGVLHATSNTALSAGLNRLTLGPFDGVIDDVSVYNVALTAAQATTHYRAGATPRANELSGARIGVYLDAIGWPASLRNIDLGNSQMQPASTEAYSQPAYANVQDIATTENGQVFFDAAGKITFYDRFHTSRVPFSTPALVLGDSGTVDEEPFNLAGLDPVLDDSDIWNDMAVTPKGMGAQTARDTASQSRYGKRTRSISTLNASPVEAAGRASADLSRYKDPLSRIKAVPFTPMSDPTMLFPAALAFDLLTRVELKRRPKDNSSSTFDQVALIEGIQHQVDAQSGKWETTWRLSPTDATPMFWIIDDPVAGRIVDGASQSPPVVIGY